MHGTTMKFIHRCLTTNSMEHRPYWEADSFSAGPVPPFLWKLWFCYSLHNSPVFVLSWTRLIQSSTPAHHISVRPILNVIFPYSVESSNRSPSLRYLHQNPVYISPPPTCHIPFPYHSSLFDYPNNIWRGIQMSSFVSKPRGALWQEWFIYGENCVDWFIELGTAVVVKFWILSTLFSLE